MAKGRTVSARCLTKKDEQIIGICKKISDKIEENISSLDQKIDFRNNWGKISKSRDGGAGRGAGKLQRDALCTRGKTDKTPISNRNLRWHPLVVASSKVDYAKEIEEVKVIDDDLYFIVKDSSGNIIEYKSDEVYKLEERYVIKSEDWDKYVSILREWDEKNWTKNSCVIPALEACNWEDAVETYAVLGLSVAVALYRADFNKLYKEIVTILEEQDIDKNIKLPSGNFPKKNIEEIINCPMAKIPINKNLEYIRKEPRGNTWQPNWGTSKRSEGEDSSLQIMHINPLVEKEMRHKANNVRYGFRWCNVAMTDHSLEETLDFMVEILKAHRRI